MTTLFLRAWSHYLRLTTHWPSIGTIVPFIPLIVAWWIVTELQVFPRAFLPGPAEVVRSFGSLVYTGVLPEYLQDSLVRLAVGGREAIRRQAARDARRYEQLRQFFGGC
jgi:NitT/TauT family transport system permease protein/taurine transport system permease protein